VKRIAIQGAFGSFSEEAARLHFRDADIVPFRTFDDAAEAVARGMVDYAVLPVENRIAGTVPGMAAIVARPDFQTVAEVVIPVHHFLMAPHGSSVERLHSVLSHPVALAQCGRFFARHPNLERTEWFDTAGAAQHVASLNNPQVAAVAARGAATLYGLAILAENIEDRPDNATRFAVLTRV
jgi:prephenate dehydratase